MTVPTPEKQSGLARFETELGWCGFLYSSKGITDLTFGHDSHEEVLRRLGESHGASHGSAPEWVANAQNLLVRYAAGEVVDLNDIPVDLGEKTDFQLRVIQRVMGLGVGETASYGEVAEDVGASGAARAVGNVMRTNRIPLVIPCHRVVGAGGALGGYSAPSGLSMKERLLALEREMVGEAQTATT